MLTCFVVAAFFIIAAIFPGYQDWARINHHLNLFIVAGRNVNMVSGIDEFTGDPWLQRQNEPSMAVSTRNELHLLAGANDYRTVDIPIPDEELPGIPEQATAGDAWLGVFKSIDGGESWTSTLLPGYPQDISTEGMTSPIYGLPAAADPTVRAGANGIFYYSGIAFERVEHGRSVIFVARYIDNNNVEGGDPFGYIDTKIIDEGTSGQFGDKPWLAVDVPQNDLDKVPIMGNPIPYQEIPRHNIYIAYSMFLGDLAQSVHNKILFARSTDCGNTWEKPIKLSESQHINQGTTIAIDPLIGTVYVAWRRFQSGDEPDAILFCKSKDGGQKFSKATEVIQINPFDQGTSEITFRTNSFPALAVDSDGIVYLAWAEKGLGPQGDARIVLMTSGNGGNTWNSPMAIDNHGGPGHQIMPTLAFGAGRLTAAWYDFRHDESGIFEMDYIRETPPVRHTVDVRAIRGEPGVNPLFGPSIQVSQYLWALYEDPQGNYQFQQIQFNPPNYPLFKSGTVPFHGDYIDITPSPMFVRDLVFSPMSSGATTGDSSWRFNTEDLDPSDFHVTWTDNRDVRPPDDNIWTNYTAPKLGCTEENTGMRNQNIYTSKITDGILIGCPGNFKPPGDIQHAFVVFVKNLTVEDKYFRLEIQTGGISASFLQFEPLADIEAGISPHSSISRPVFVEATSTPTPIRVDVVEISGLGGDPLPGGFHGYINLNPDPTNPENTNIVSYEGHDPEITSVNILNWLESNVNILNPTVVDVNILNREVMDVNILNPNETNVNILNVNILNPNEPTVNILNVNILNVNILNNAIAEEEFDPNTTTVSDIQWTVENTGNATSSYTFRTIAGDSPPEGIYTQLLVHKIHHSPYADGCTPEEDERHELLVNILNVNILNPNYVDVNILNPDIENSDIANATFFLAPGEEAVVSLRLIDPIGATPGGEIRSQRYLETQNFLNNVGAAATAHAVNSDGTTNPIDTTPLQIMTYSLPYGFLNEPYKTDEDGDVFVKAFGGTEPYEWSIISGNFPPDLSFEPVINPETGNVSDTVKIYGTPTASDTYTFTVEVSDLSGETASQTLTIHILEPLSIITNEELPPGEKNFPYDETLAAKGGVTPYSWSLVDKEGEQLPDGLILESDGWIHGTPTSAGDFTFTVSVTDSHDNPQEEEKTFTIYIEPEPLIITTEELPDGYVGTSYDATLGATGGEGPLSWSFVDDPEKIPPPGLEISNIGEITGKPKYNPDISYPHPYNFRVQVIDSLSQNVSRELTITVYPKMEEWIGRYGEDGDEQAAAIVADDSGNVYMTGNSGGDVFTLKYGNSQETQDSFGLIWEVSYDGPDNLIDEAAAIALDSEGNVYVTGFSTGNTTGEDIVLIKYDPDGNMDWDRTFDGPAQLGDRGRAIAVDSTGVYVTGSSYRGMNFAHSDIPVLKYDFSGNLIWDVSYDSRRNGMDKAHAIALDSSGVYITGESEESSGSDKDKDYDYITVKYDKTNGNEIWKARYDGPAQDDDQAFAIVLDSSFVYVTGRSQGGATGYDFATVKYAKTNGREEWAMRTDASGEDEATAAAADSSGNVFVTGFLTDTATGLDYCTIKYNDGNGNGNEEWNIPYSGPGSGEDKATAIAVDSTGVYVTGFVTGESSGADFVTIKYDNGGNIVWLATYNGTGNGMDVPIAIVLDSSSVYVTGTSEGSGTANDLVIVKYEK